MSANLVSVVGNSDSEHITESEPTQVTWVTSTTTTRTAPQLSFLLLRIRTLWCYCVKMYASLSWIARSKPRRSTMPCVSWPVTAGPYFGHHASIRLGVVSWVCQRSSYGQVKPQLISIFCRIISRVPPWTEVSTRWACYPVPGHHSN